MEPPVPAAGAAQIVPNATLSMNGLTNFLLLQDPGLGRLHGSQSTSEDDFRKPRTDYGVEEINNVPRRLLIFSMSLPQVSVRVSLGRNHV